MECAPNGKWAAGVVSAGFLVASSSPAMAAFVDSPDVQVFVPGIGTQHEAIETAVAVHPEQDATILAACMIALGTNAYDVAAFVSTDAGNSWSTTPSVSPEGQGAPGDDYADPVVAWVRTGPEWTALVGFLAEKVANIGRHLKIARSTDLGATWVSSTVTYRAAGNGLDKPWMAATHDGTGHVHMAYVAYDPAPDSLKIEVVRSPDAGTTWSLPALVGTGVPGGHHLPRMAVGPDSEVYVAFATFDGTGTAGGEKGYGLVKSTDAGQTWSNPGAPGVQGVQGIFGVGPPFHFRHNSQPALTICRSIGPNRGDVYLGWTNLDAEGEPGFGDDRPTLYVVRSTDGGASFGSWQPIGGGARPTQWGIDMVCHPTNGALAAVWYDHDPGAVSDVGDDDLACWTSFSTDAGATWQSMQAGDLSAGLDAYAGQVNFMGDYIGIDASGWRVVPFWMDARSGTNQVYMSPFIFPDWSEIVTLNWDFLVGTGQVLEIAPGTIVRAVGFTDLHNVGRFPDLVEVVVDGETRINGNYGSPVTFTSTVPTAGSHGGLLFRDTADMSTSDVYYADFEYPVYGIEVDSLGGTIYGCRFTKTETGDIRVTRDTRITENATWRLDPPTHLLFATRANDQTPPGHSFGGDGDGVEAKVAGAFVASAPAGSDSVWIVPELTGGATLTDMDFQGLTLSSFFGLGQLDLNGVVIRGAENPVVVEFGTSAIVRNSTIEWYQNNGIVDYGVGAEIRYCVIDGLEAGETQNTGPGTGVLLNRSTGFVLSNVIGWHRNSAIDVAFTETDCEYPIQPDTLRVIANTLTGEGAESQSHTTGSGVAVTWGCNHRHVRIEDNTITAWPEVGVDLVQCADTRLTCNAVNDNRIGVRHERSIAQPGGKNHLKWNTVHGSVERNVLVLESQYIALGDAPKSTGNDLRSATNASNLKKLPIGSPDLDARYTYWRDAAGSLLTADLAIRATFDPSGGVATVDITGYGVIEPPELCGPGQADPVVETSLEGDGDASRDPPASASPGAATPSRTELLEVRSGAEAGPLTIRLAIAGSAVEGVELSVFDVTGRRVRSLIRGRLPGGYHEVVWDRTNDSGARCVAGVYFLRMTASPYDGVRKVVLIR